MMIFIDQIEAIFGEISMTNPAFILVVTHRRWPVSCSSGGTTAVMVFAVSYDASPCGSCRGLGGRLVVAIPAIVHLGAVFSGTITDPFEFSPRYGVLPALATTLAIGRVEELGWRGVSPGRA